MKFMWWDSRRSRYAVQSNDGPGWSQLPSPAPSCRLFHRFEPTRYTASPDPAVKKRGFSDETTNGPSAEIAAPAAGPPRGTAPKRTETATAAATTVTPRPLRSNSSLPARPVNIAVHEGRREDLNSFIHA
jgi:hypothetical protein